MAKKQRLLASQIEKTKEKLPYVNFIVKIEAGKSVAYFQSYHDAAYVLYKFAEKYLKDSDKIASSSIAEIVDARYIIASFICNKALKKVLKIDVMEIIASNNTEIFPKPESQF